MIRESGESQRMKSRSTCEYQVDMVAEPRSAAPIRAVGLAVESPTLEALVVEGWNVWYPQLEATFLSSSRDLEAASRLQDGPKSIIQPSGNRLAEGWRGELHPILESG